MTTILAADVERPQQRPTERTRRTVKREGERVEPGNNGDWYLELVGAKRPDAGPPTRFEELDSVAATSPPSPPPPPPAPATPPPAPPTPTPPRIEPAPAAAATSPRPTPAAPATPAAHPAPVAASEEATGEVVSTADTTTELVGRLWDATGRQDPLENWTPEELSRTIQSKRNFRWTVIVAVVVIVAVAWVLVAWLPSLPRTRADQRTDEYRAALSELRATLPSSQTAIALVTDPAEVTDSLGEVIAALTELDASAQRVTRIAAEPLPAGIPLLSRAPIEQLEPIRDQIGMIGADAEVLAGRVNDAFTYRTLYASILDLPPLPSRARTERANELSVELAALLADTVGVRAELPSGDPVFAAHLAATDEAVDRYSRWQVDYIDSLRSGDEATADGLVDEMQALRAALDVELLQTLAEFRSVADTELLRLADVIDQAVAGLPD